MFTGTSALGVTSFPSLNNAGDTVLLKDPYNQQLDLVVYTDDWYKDDVKQDGGYSLELINLNDPCSDENNWIASTDATGGTPGLINSVYDLTPDTQAPNFSLLLASAPNYLQIWFDEGMDSSSLVNASYLFSPGLSPGIVYANGAFTNTVILQFAQNLVPSQVYTITLQNVSDCWLNSQTLVAQFALTETPLAGEIVVNEILQNPYNGGQDWIELYNNSNKIFNLKNLQFANLVRKADPGLMDLVAVLFLFFVELLDDLLLQLPDLHQQLSQPVVLHPPSSPLSLTSPSLGRARSPGGPYFNLRTGTCEFPHAASASGKIRSKNVS